MPAPRVSVALCTYNGAAFLPQQFDSLLAQDLREVELIAADDASSDASWQILNDYAPRFAAARLIRNPVNLGLRANFEQVFRACRGEWIAPCDQDDVWLPGKLSRLLAAADAGTTLVYCDSRLIDERGEPLVDARRGDRVSGRYRMVGGRDARSFALANCISGHASLVRAALLERALPLPEGVAYDAWLAFVAANLGEIRHVAEPLVLFRQHARNASGFAGQLRQGARRPAIERCEAECRHLEALAGFDGPHQDFFRELLALWRERPQRWLTPGLARFLYRHRESVFAMKPTAPGTKAKHALKYLRGLRGA